MLPFPVINKTNIILPRKIKKIQASTDGAFVLFESGNLYAFGFNYLQQFGSGTTSGATYKNWTLVHSNVTDVYTGVDSVIIKLADGSWQYAGNTKTSGTSNSDTAVGNWTTLPGMQYFTNNGLTIKEIQVGGTNIGVLCTNDTLYQMVYNVPGVFGIGTSTNSTTFVVSRTNVDRFSFGHLSALCTDKGTGQLYKAGWNNNSQLGAPNSTTSFPTWTSVGVAPIGVFTGRYTTSYITSAGVLYSTGLKQYGAITGGTGNNDTSVVSSYTQLSSGIPAGALVNNTNFYHTKSWMTYFRTGQGIYVAGRNDNGQLSVGNQNAITTYTALTLPSGVLESQVEDIHFNSYLSLILKNDGISLYVAGNSNYFPQYTGIQSTYVKLDLPE